MTENSPEQPIVAENPKTIWRTDSFINQMENAVSRHPVSYEKLPDIIELEGSNIAQSADKIVEETFKDPERRERSVGAKINLKGRMIIDATEQVGNQKQVDHVFELGSVSLEEDKYEMRERPVFLMHTHGPDFPVSPLDIRSLITNPDHGVQSILVLTQTTKMIFVRTLQTPEIGSETELDTIVSTKTKMIKDERSLPAGFEESNKMGIRVVKHIKVVLDMCREYKIGVYISFNGHRYSRMNI